MKARTAALLGVGLGLGCGVLAAGVYGAATGADVELRWVQPALETTGFVVMVGLSVANFLLMYAVFRWITRYLGFSRSPIVTRQIGGHDVRKSRRGTELPPLRFMFRRLWCKHAVVARVRHQEGREVRCAGCGADLQEGPAETWV